MEPQTKCKKIVRKNKKRLRSSLDTNTQGKKGVTYKTLEETRPKLILKTT